MITTRFTTWLAVATLTYCFTAITALGGEMIEVVLRLVLSADVSGSMEPDELRIQRDGYVFAFRHPDLVRAILSGPLGCVAVTYVEWAGCYAQSVVVPWTVLDDSQSIEQFAQHLSVAPAGRSGYRTAVSCALLFAATQFHSSSLRSRRKIVSRGVV